MAVCVAAVTRRPGYPGLHSSPGSSPRSRQSPGQQDSPRSNSSHPSRGPRQPAPNSNSSGSAEGFCPYGDGFDGSDAAKPPALYAPQAADIVGQSGGNAAADSAPSRPSPSEKMDPLLALVLKNARDRPPRGFWKFHVEAAKMYCDIRVQVVVAGLICCNFATNVAEKQWDPRKIHYLQTWNQLDFFYNFIFAIELAVNMYGFWLRPFWSSTWNWFDFVVVSLGVLDMAEVDLPGQFKLLRMMRAFRVFRLFKRVKSLNKILVSLVRAVPGVANAFVIMMIVMAIFAMLAVQFYHTMGFEEHDTELVCEDKFVTSRGNCFGWEYFGDFLKALYSLFQILTGESWSEMIVRLVLIEGDGVAANISAGFFFLTFYVLNAIVLINVVVAVLLDKMANETDEEKAAHAEEALLEEALEDDLAGNPKEAAALAKEEVNSSPERIVAVKAAAGDRTRIDSHLHHEVLELRGELTAASRQIASLDAVAAQQLEGLETALQQILSKLDANGR